MNKNTYSLLNSPWMMIDSSASAMMPFLISLAKGTPIKEAEPESLLTCYAEYDDEDSGYNIVQDTRSDAKYIPVLSIKNTIYKYDQVCGPRGTQSMMALMDEWKGNDNILGVVLDQDCGGGQHSGTREFANYIHNYSKPVVTYVRGVSGSAAYWLAAACKGGIVMNPYGDVAGCIGSMMKRVNLEGILRNQGAVIEDIYPPESPRKNEEQRALDKGDQAPLIVNILSPSAVQFHSDLKTFRPQIKEEAYDGAIYFPEACLTMGLVDKLGSIQDAFDIILSMTSKTSKSKNSNTMSNKSRPKVEAVLGLSAPLVSTDKGSYLQDEQLDTLESSLEAAETATATVQGQLDTATASLTQAQADLTAAQAAHTNDTTATTTAVDDLVTAAGITANGTVTEKLAALGSHYAVINKKDGAAHTTTKIDNNQASEAVKSVGGIDVTAALNN